MPYLRASHRNRALDRHNVLRVGDGIRIDRRQCMKPRQLRRPGDRAYPAQVNLQLLLRGHAIDNLEVDLAGRCLMRDRIGHPWSRAG